MRINFDFSIDFHPVIDLFFGGRIQWGSAAAGGGRKLHRKHPSEFKDIIIHTMKKYKPLSILTENFG